MILVQVACAGREEAEMVARGLLEARLVACASIGAPVRSWYWWQGKLEEAEEVPLVLKTRRERFAEVEAMVRRLHSYEVPEIVATEVVAGSAGYLAWVEGEVSAGK